MDVQEIKARLEASMIANQREATHFNPVDKVAYKFADNEQSREELAQIVFDANKLKQPIVLTERLVNTNMALHFKLEIRTNDDLSKFVKSMAGRIGKVLQEDSYGDEIALKAVIFGTKGQGVYKAQVIFPQIIVDATRLNKLRIATMGTLAGNEHTDIVKQLVEYDQRNLMNNVFVESDLDTNGVEIPLTSTFTEQMQVDGPLNPIALATVNKVKGVTPLDAPSNKSTWVLLGLKRAPGHELTKWTEPRQFRDKKGGEKGKSGQSGKSKPSDDKGGK